MRTRAAAWLLLLVLPAAAGPVRKATEDAARNSRRARPEVVADVVPVIGNRSPRAIGRPKATFIAPHFEELRLGPGDTLVVRAPGPGGRSWTYTRSRDAFWGVAIPGNRLLLELKNASGTAAYRVDRYAAGMPPARIINHNVPPAGLLQICGADDTREARCYAGDAALATRARPVARLLINGSEACTGWLVGSEGHMLTNEHCIRNAGDAANVNVEFLAEGATCDTDCDDWFACPGTVVATQAELIAASRADDYALLRLPRELAATYGHLTLRRTGAILGERIFIPQHPRGAGKRLAVASTHAFDQSGETPGFAHVNTLVAPACDGGTAREVGYAADTDGGSSGSPVIAVSDGRVVALHHCAGCPNRAIPIERVIAGIGRHLPADAFGE